MEHNGVWSEATYDRLMQANGSLDGVAEAPAAVKDRYRVAPGEAPDCVPAPAAGVTAGAPLGEPAGPGLTREFFSTNLDVQTRIDDETGLRVSTRTKGSSGRMLPSTTASHSVLHSAWVDGTGWPQPDPTEFKDYYAATGSRYTVRAGDTL